MTFAFVYRKGIWALERKQGTLVITCYLASATHADAGVVVVAGDAELSLGPGEGRASPSARSAFGRSGGGVGSAL